MVNSKALYQKFCQENQARIPIFAQPWYLDAVCIDGIWDVAILEEKGEILAVLPYFLKQKWGFRYITMPLFTKYLGTYLAKDFNLTEQHDILEKLITQLPKAQAFHQNFHPDITDWLPFYWASYQQTTRYTYQLDLSDLDAVFNNINRNMRRNIKKAQTQLLVSLDGTPQDFYAINCLSFERQGLKMPYSLEQFLKHDQALAAHNARQIFFTKDESGKIHAAAYLIWDARNSYYHLSGDDPEWRHSGAGILLVWEAIRYTKEKLNLNLFDFEGSMMQNVEAIRRQFGATQVPYFYIWKYQSTFLKWIQTLKG
ncbi:MAG: GNAT family N-acetyltransferase [Saprospiraceae bacterium]|nr:GNAT family N-acetyltransferase [Saprospiraceae bacterium]